jgi:D-alanyl-lipoteichoic acid acyltransferase DltB (MBOAT superfamily)
MPIAMKHFQITTTRILCKDTTLFISTKPQSCNYATFAHFFGCLALLNLTSIADWLHDALWYDDRAPLVFTQLTFWLFFACVMLLYGAIYRRSAAIKSAYLLAVSMFFYYKASGVHVAALAFAVLVTYLAALCIGAAHGRWRKAWLAAGIAVNALLLAYFKYFGFIVQSINDIFGLSLHAVNLFAAAADMLAGSSLDDADMGQIALPVGISFYIFQALGYLIDVYRSKISAVKNMLHFGFYMSFFPQLVAGPIVRANEFIPQVFREYQLSGRQFWTAVLLILGGLVKKMALSDYLAFNYVDRIFDAPSLYSGFELLTGTYGYAIQIYCDFSGYTDIALGLAAMLGFALPINFRCPYGAVGLSDFWRRWHISLSLWLRDYLYIPLGGNRCGAWRQRFNLLLTMLLGGLWHGASWKFLLWGMLHGLLLALEKALTPFIGMRMRGCVVLRFVYGLLTFHVVCVLWIFFRCDDAQAACAFILRMFGSFNADVIVEVLWGYLPVFCVMGCGYAMHFMPVVVKRRCNDVFVMLPIAVKLLVVLLVIFVVMQLSAAHTQPFIYFQF